MCKNIYFETFLIYRKVKEQYYEQPYALHLHWPIINILLYLYVHIFSLSTHTRTHIFFQNYLKLLIDQG